MVGLATINRLNGNNNVTHLNQSYSNLSNNIKPFRYDPYNFYGESPDMRSVDLDQPEHGAFNLEEIKQEYE